MSEEVSMMEPLLLPEGAGMSPGCPGWWVCSHWLEEEGNSPGCNAPALRTSLLLSSQSQEPCKTPCSDLEHPTCGKGQAWRHISLAGKVSSQVDEVAGI